MSQENRDNNKPPRYSGRPPGEDPNQAPRKGPRFSIYWIYLIIFAVLLGFQFFGSLSPNTAKTNSLEFREMILSGDVKKYDNIDNRKTIKIYLTKQGIEKHRKKLKEGISGKIS